MVIILIVFVLLFLLFVLSTRGRGGHRGIEELGRWRYAHRGLHGPGIPENSLKAFQEAKDHGYGVELDVHLLRDGNLAVIHDYQMLRCTGVDGNIEDQTTQKLPNLFLEGTDESVPTFQAVLELFAGAAPIIVELKSTKDNYKQLCETACNMLEQYDGAFYVESFDPRCLFWLRLHRPELIRGQLTENYFAKRGSDLPWFLKFVLKNLMLNFLTLPDFVAYRFEDRKTFANFLYKKIWHMKGVAWTITNYEEYKQAEAEGLIPIFENFMP